MKNSIKVRTDRDGEITKIRVLIRHPMETGLRKDRKSGKPIPAHFITEVTCKKNGKIVFTALWGIAVSKNPYLLFTLTDVNSGDVLTITWLDNTGDTDKTIVDM